MAQDEKIFANGFSFKRSEKAPDFVVGRLSMKADEAVAFIREHEKSGWVNVNIKKARTGNYYVELDTYESSKDGAKANPKPSPESKQADVEDEDLPF